MFFWLGTHQVHWLGEMRVPLFVSAARLRLRKSLPKALAPWALDSGGFTALSRDGCYLVGPRQYTEEVRRWRDEVGNLRWAAVQDWMCEPQMRVKTRCSVETHQQLTVNSWIALNSLAGDLPWIPILQGWSCDDYHRCADLYERACCLRLAREPVVGLGSLCRRKGTQEAAEIILSLWNRGITTLHGFGFKTAGLVNRRCPLAAFLGSSDSMAWSVRAYRAYRHDGRRLCGELHTGSCASCKQYAAAWRERLVGGIAAQACRPCQGTLF